MEYQKQEIDNLNNKLVELHGKLIRIQYRLDTLDNTNVKAQPINQPDSAERTESREVRASERPNK